VQILALFGEVVSNGDVQMVRMGEKGWEDVSQRQGTNPTACSFGWWLMAGADLL
jgi:hypothetical protein